MVVVDDHAPSAILAMSRSLRLEDLAVSTQFPRFFLV